MGEILRYSDNPIITRRDVPFRVNSIFNAGAVKHGNKYLLLCRIEMANGRSSLVVAESGNGYDFQVENKPCLTPHDHGEFKQYTEWGIEDPRIVEIEGSYYLTYTGYSKSGTVVILSETKDFKTFRVLGPISEPPNKDCTIFPDKIDGYYWKLDRPSTEDNHNIWISKSPDLIHWGDYRLLLESMPGTWETGRIGASTPPIKTKDGWLMLYHGARDFGNGAIYKIGTLLLDIDNPAIVKGKSEEPILSPEMDYERVGDVNNVVFTNGWIVEGNKVKIYYSGADTNICLAETDIDYLLSTCL